MTCALEPILGLPRGLLSANFGSPLGNRVLGHVKIIYEGFRKTATGFSDSVEDPEEVIKRVGLRISELRAESKLTQAQVAESLGTTVSNYQRIEHGLQNVTVRMIVRIAGVIGVPSSELWEAPNSQQARRGRPKKR